MRSCLGLAALPEEAGQLGSLKGLCLQSLPVGLWSLRELEVLDLSDCGLVVLPEEIRELVMLKKLDLSHNKRLELLPAGLGMLKELEEQFLQGCDRLTVETAFGFALQDLRDCSFLGDNGKLQPLPAGLSQLQHLTKLDISECPSLATMHELNQQGGVRAVQGFLRDLRDLQGDLFEPSLRNSLKLLLVGPTEAGKTSLLRALMHGESRVLADRDTERTIGLDIHRLQLADPKGRMGGDVPLVLVTNDAGGQGLVAALLTRVRRKAVRRHGRVRRRASPVLAEWLHGSNPSRWRRPGPADRDGRANQHPVRCPQPAP